MSSVTFQEYAFLKNYTVAAQDDRASVELPGNCIDLIVDYAREIRLLDYIEPWAIPNVIQESDLGCVKAPAAFRSQVTPYL